MKIKKIHSKNTRKHNQRDGKGYMRVSFKNILVYGQKDLPEDKLYIWRVYIQYYTMINLSEFLHPSFYQTLSLFTSKYTLLSFNFTFRKGCFNNTKALTEILMVNIRKFINIINGLPYP